MSKHHNPQRNSMMPAPKNPEPPFQPPRIGDHEMTTIGDDTPIGRPIPFVDPPMRAYAVNRTSEGWEMRVLMLPRDVVEQYTAKQVADVLPIVIAKVAMDIERVAEGRAGLEHSA